MTMMVMTPSGGYRYLRCGGPRCMRPGSISVPGNIRSGAMNIDRGVCVTNRRGHAGRMDRRRAATAEIDAFGKTGDGKITVDPNADLITKLKTAWKIFFPDKPKSLSPKEEGKKRLRMILVADRCGMTADSLAGMRESIVRAMEDYVEVEAEEAVEVNMSMDPEIGTIYSVAVPVKRVKSQLRLGVNDEAAPGLRIRTVSDESGGTWDPMDPESDPSDQFPYGT